MNPLQEYLQNHTLEQLVEEFHIAVIRHPTLPLVAFKYDQIDSPKTHPVVRYCRGTVLEDKTWALVAMPFVRFFNYGENEEEGKLFNWKDFSATTKEDGSLILLWHYAGSWHVKTSGSWGFGLVGFSTKTWIEHFWELFNKASLIKDLEQDKTYIFEFCSLDNQVVRLYKEPQLFLLSATCQGVELPSSQVDEMSVALHIPRPQSHDFHSIDEIMAFLQKKEETDKTFEGVVIRDCNNIRFKLKNPCYLALAHLSDNGNVANPKHLVAFALAGEGDEMIAIFPYLKDRFAEVKNTIDAAFATLQAVWEANRGVAEQKEFALRIIKATPFNGLLFTLRKTKGVGLGELADLKQMWRNSAELIVKRLF
jgi:hypothetical protein